MTARGHKGALTDLTAERARELFDYDSETGSLAWRIGPRKGKIAGYVCRDTKGGRVKVWADGHLRMAHRVIWLWMTGEWPEFEVDHEDTDSTNNRWKNLRPATSSQNQWNAGKYRSNTSGYKGVAWHGQRSKWVANIQAHGVHRYLGLFATPEAAYAAYCKAAAELHGAFVNTL